MAMTKKEKQAHDEVVNSYRLRLALRWSEPVKPDVPPPLITNAKTVGWLPCHDRVEPSCSTAIYHSVGRTDQATSQESRSLYSTRNKALKALRHEMELRFANELKRIDDWIAQEQETPTPIPR